MKKYIYSFAVCAALFCTSCDESRLNIEQKAVSSTENFYKTDQDAVDAMTAAYAQFLDNVCSSAGIYQPQFTLLNYSADDACAEKIEDADIKRCIQTGRRGIPYGSEYLCYKGRERAHTGGLRYG